MRGRKSQLQRKRKPIRVTRVAQKRCVKKSLPSSFQFNQLVEITDIFGVLSTDSLPLHVSDLAGNTYFVKAIHARPTKFRNPIGTGDPINKPGLYMRRTLVNDHLALQLGVLIGAPTPNPAILSIPADLLDANASTIKHDLQRSDRKVPFAVKFDGAICHGSTEIEGLKSREGFPREFSSVPNPERYASLAILYSLMGGS